MKKIYALIILSLFLISLVPTITAQRIKTPKLQTASGTETRAQTQTQERAETIQTISAQKIRIQREVRERAEAKLQDLTKSSAFEKYSKELEFKARKVSEVQLEKARNNFVKAKENFVKAKEKYQTTQQKFSEAKLRVRECEDNETDGCSQIREQIKEHARENLMAIADRIIEHLNKLKAKIEANEDLSEEEAAEMIANIDEQIEAIEEIKNIIETSESKEDIIDAAKDLKKDWKGMKNRVKLNTARTVNARIGGIIVKSRQLEVKLNRIVERMVSNGEDTSSIEPLIEEFNTKVEEAKTYYEIAVEKFEEAKSTTPNTDLIREGQAAMKSAHKALQEAQKILRNIVLSIKQAGGEDDIEECETADDCEEGEVCIDGECEEEEEEECTEDADCEEGYVCTDGECVEEPICDSDNLELCLDETNCTDAGGFWYDGVCNEEEQEPVCGNDVCEEGEIGDFDTEAGCPLACAVSTGCHQRCGDNFCPEDCGFEAVCGDGICELFEKYPPSFPDREKSYHCQEDCGETVDGNETST